ncbi:MAG: MFS transporter [Brevibacillus sp.]|nr:MFS transporter [Brevibacillus sp.]
MREREETRQVKVIALITAVCLLGDSMLYVVMPTHWQSFGLSSLWEVGILLSVNRLVRLPLNPIIGWLYRRLSIRQGILIAVLLAVLTTASYGLVDGFWLLLVMRSLWGLAWSFLRIGAYYTIVGLSDEQSRGQHMGTYNGLYRLGSLGGMLVGALLADFWGADWVAVCFGLITLLALPAVFRHVSAGSGADLEGGSGGEAKREDTALTMQSIWRSRTVLWTLCTGLLLAMLYQGIFTSTMSYLMSLRLPQGFEIAGIVLGAATLAGLLQALRWGWEPFLAPWFGKKSDGPGGRRPLFVGTLVTAGLLFAAVPFEMPFVVWLFVLLAIQMTSTVLTTVMDALASDAAARASKLTVMTAYTVAIDLGAALGPVSGYLVEELWGTAALYITSGVLLLLLAVRWRKPFAMS